MVTTRRSFLRSTGVFAASLALIPSLAHALAEQKKAIGIQLYTLRDLIATDVNSIIEQVAKAGFKEVETYGYNPNGSFWGLSPKDFKTLLDANGLNAPSGHFSFDNYISTGNLDDIKAYIDATLILGGKYVVAPWLSEINRKNADDYKVVAERLNIAGELCVKSGLRVGYHNHGFEFQKFGNKTGLEIILEQTDPKLVDYELDLYWTAYAQHNPIDLFKKYPDRFKMWHVKDMNKTNKVLNTEIGKGDIDFKSIFAEASLAGVKHIYLEQETNYQPNHMSSIKSSIVQIERLIK